jgi:hypothetical protein
LAGGDPSGRRFPSDPLTLTQAIRICDVKLDGMTTAQRQLALLMSNLSLHASGSIWLSGNEYRLWRAATDAADDLRYGMGHIPRDGLKRIRLLARSLDGWIVWNETPGAAGDWLRFLPLAVWERRYADFLRATGPCKTPSRKSNPIASPPALRHSFCPATA